MLRQLLWPKSVKLDFLKIKLVKMQQFGKISNSNLSREKDSTIEVFPILSKDFCSTGSSSINNSNSDAKFGPVIQDITDNPKLQLDPPLMDVDDEDLGNNLNLDNFAMQEPDSDGEDFVVGLAQITGDRERMDVAIVAKGSEYIEATAVDDEWMQDRQDLVTYHGRGAPAAGRGSGRGVSHSGRGRGRGQRSSEALITFPWKVCTTSCDCASNCWIQEPGEGTSSRANPHFRGRISFWWPPYCRNRLSLEACSGLFRLEGYFIS